MAYNTASSNKEARNRLQDVLIERSDSSCGSFLDGLYARVAGRKSVLKMTALFASAAGAIVTGEDAQRILAGTAAAAVGVDAIMDSEVLQNQITTLIISQIQTTRKEIGNEIVAKREKDHNKYSVDEAIRDVGRYHAACSFTAAITELTKNASRARLTKAKISEELSTLATRRDAVREALSKVDLTQTVRTSYENELKQLDNRINGLQALDSAVTE